MLHDNQHIKQPERRCRHHAEVTRDDGSGVILEKGGPALIAARSAGPGAGDFGRYFPIVRGETRRPSFSRSSLAMRSSPHEGFSRAISRIGRWSSGGIGGRPN